MIVASMNLHQVYEHLMEEKRKLDWKRDSYLEKAAKEIRRQGTYPAWVLYDYTVPASNNTYILYYYATHPLRPILSDALCVLFDDNKRYIIKWTDTEKPEIHVLTSHFLQRYRDRFLCDEDMSANDVAVRFFTRNEEMKPMAIDERINRNIAEYGEYADEGFLVNDGLCFKLSGEEKRDDGSVIKINFFTTFMPTFEMSETQRQAIFEEYLKSIDNITLRDSRRAI